MLVFGHAGITLGAATLAMALRRRQSSQTGALASAPNPQTSWFALLGRSLDIRLLLLGSLLPDIIDKPLGHVFFRETFSGGRLFSHTLLLLLLMASLGFYLYRRYHQKWLLAVALGSFSHLVLDEMWSYPRTLLWPLFGFGFERINLDNWLAGIFFELLNDPVTYVSELVGLAVLLWFGIWLLRRRKLLAFIGRGRVE